MAIKAIIFDLGGVIIDINYTLTIQAFKRIGASNFDQVYSQFKQSNLFDHYETGKMNCATFREDLKRLLDLPVNDEQFDEAWNAMLMELPGERLEFIRRLRQDGYKTFLFSNTNAIHIKKVFEICQQTAGVKDFTGCFVQEYYSHTFGMRKPHKESFEKILQEHGLNACETLFVEDTPQHIEGAKQAGIHTLLIDKDHSIFDVVAAIERINKQENQKSKALPEQPQDSLSRNYSI